MINTSFYLRRLHSLCGLVLLGGVLIEHILTNAAALGGPAVFNGALEMMELIPKPLFISIELAVYAVPILFHGIYGIYIAMQANNNQQNYGYARNWQCGLPMSFELVQSVVTNPIVFVLYILGMFAAIFHFCNGITTFCMTWGITKGPRSQCYVDKMSMGLAAFLCLVVLAFMGNYMM